MILPKFYVFQLEYKKKCNHFWPINNHAILIVSGFNLSFTNLHG